MAYNTRSIKKDVDGRPIPQYFNSTADDYEPLLGENGAARSVLYGPNGQPLSVIDNKLAVRAADLETLIGALNDSAVTNPANAASVIAALKGLLSVVGKEATLGQILLALGSLATESTLASLASSVAKEATLSGVKSAVDTLAGIVSDGAAKVTLSGSIDVLYDDQPPKVTRGVIDCCNKPTSHHYKEVRVGLALHSGIVGKWRVTITHLHRRGGNTLGTDTAIDISTGLGGTGSVSLKGSFFQVRIHNDNDFDGRPWAFVVLGVR